MKLIRVRIENFRILKELALDFATTDEKNLTVIRAANESGKTTLLMALQWGLFGDEALPDRGRNFRLSPIDGSGESATNVMISVEVDWQISTRVGRRVFRVMRFAKEELSGVTWRRGSTNVKLFELNDSGASPIDYPDGYMRPHLPSDLREVFFTDGDRALNFIEGSKGDQMQRVTAVPTKI